MTKLTLFLLVLALLSAVHLPVSAGGSEKYALMGKKAWYAFECASLNSLVGNKAEAKRLFFLGHNNGRRLLKALKENKIKEKDISNEVPWILMLLFEGPSDDFILGRIYSAAERDALKDILNTEGKPNPDEVQKVLARNKISNSKCRSIR